MNHKAYILMAGPVSSGKTTLMREIEDCVPGVTGFDMGDYAREAYHMAPAEEQEQMDLSEWADYKKETDCTEWCADYICDTTLPDYGFLDIPVISGIRSPEEIDRYVDYFGEDTPALRIFVTASIYDRYDWHANREGRTIMSPGEFFERDYREYNWGMDKVADMMNGVHDLRVGNSSEMDLDHLKTMIVARVIEFLNDA